MNQDASAERLLTRFGPIAFALVAAAVGFVYIAILGFIAGLWTGAGHGDYRPVRIVSEPFNLALFFWPVVFASGALTRMRPFSILGIVLVVSYYARLWIADIFGDVRRLDSAFSYLFIAHIIVTLNLLLFFMVRLVRPTLQRPVES